MPELLQITTNNRGRDAELTRQMRDIYRLAGADVRMQDPVHEPPLDNLSRGQGLDHREVIGRDRPAEHPPPPIQQASLLKRQQGGADGGATDTEILRQHRLGIGQRGHARVGQPVQQGVARMLVERPGTNLGSLLDFKYRLTPRYLNCTLRVNEVRRLGTDMSGQGSGTPVMRHGGSAV
jgi:hypothetical protein